METNKRQHFISLFILSLLLSCSGEKKDSAQTETVSNKAIVRIETVSAQDVEQISEFTATVEANISNNIAPQNPVRIEKLFAEVGDHVKAGTPVSITGETGRATTDHVHFEIRINGKTIDPALVIDFNNQTLLHKRLVFTPTPKGKIQVEAV